MQRLDEETRQAILSTLKKYADNRLKTDYLLELDQEEKFPREVIDELYDPSHLGLHLLFIPEEFGGLGGGAYDIYRVAELLASIDLGIATSVLATFLGSDPIKVGGTPEQKKIWMSRVADEALLMAYAATEPQAGSDLAALSTRADPVYEEGRLAGYKLNGRKQWISNGGVADLYSVLAIAPGGPTWFIVPQDTPGFSKGKPENKHGIRASNTAALFLDEVFVPLDRMIGGVEGQGLAQAQAVFGYTRLMVGAFGLGAGWEALGRAIRYSQERIQGGAPLSQKQGYTHKLIVPNAARLEAARAYIEWVADRLDGGEEGLATEGAVAKYLATEAGNRAAEDAIQALGGYGYTHEYLVEKIKRDVRITTIYEGTSEIMEWTIARDRWQSHLKTQGKYYQDWATRLEQTASQQPENGANCAASALKALALILEKCRLERLTRNQHVLFRLGEFIALAEGAAVFSERTAAAPTQAGPLDADTRRTLARIYARQAALTVATEGIEWLVGSSGEDFRGQNEPAHKLAEALGLPGIFGFQAGLMADMNCAAERLAQAFHINVNSG